MRSIIAGFALSVLVVPVSFSATETQGFHGSIGGGGYRVEVEDFEDTSTTINLLGGYDFNQYFAVEGAYRHLFEVSDSTQGVSLDIDGDVWEVSAKAAYPLSERVSAFGRVGWAFFEFEGSIDTPLGTVSADEDDDDFTWAVGAS